MSIDDYYSMDNNGMIQDYNDYNLEIADAHDYIDDLLYDDDYKDEIADYYDDLYERSLYDDLDSLLLYDDDQMSIDTKYYDDAHQTFLDFIYNYLLFEELMFDKVVETAKESKEDDKPMVGSERNGYLMYKYKKGDTLITIKQFALVTSAPKPTKGTPYAALSEFIGDYVVYKTLEEVFKGKYDYALLFSNFWQRLRIAKVTFPGKTNSFPSIDYSRQYITDVAINKEILKATGKADLYEMTYNPDHFKQIAVIILIDIINMNDDRFRIDKHFLMPPDEEYHGNLFLGENIKVIIPFDNGYAREYIEKLFVKDVKDVKSRQMDKYDRCFQRFITSDKNSKKYLAKLIGGYKTEIWNLKIYANIKKYKKKLVLLAVEGISRYTLWDDLWYTKIKDQMANKIKGYKGDNKALIDKLMKQIGSKLRAKSKLNGIKLKQYFPLPQMDYIADYQSKLRIFTANLIEIAYNLVWKTGGRESNEQLFRKLNKGDKNKAVKIIYQTWLKYGRTVCEILPIKLKQAMAKLEKLTDVHKAYVNAEKMIENKAWNFPNYLPVFKELQRIISQNARMMKLLMHSKKKYNEEIFDKEMERLSKINVNEDNSLFLPK